MKTARVLINCTLQFTGGRKWKLLLYAEGLLLCRTLYYSLNLVHYNSYFHKYNLNPIRLSTNNLFIFYPHPLIHKIIQGIIIRNKVNLGIIVDKIQYDN